MFDLLGYVKTFLSNALIPSRKRRGATDETERPAKKFRRTSNSQMSNNEDDWISTSSSSSIKRQYGLYSNGNKYLDNSKFNDNKQKLSWSKKHSVITIDNDDEDVTKKNKDIHLKLPNSSKNKFTFSPMQSFNKSDSFTNSSFEKKYELFKKKPSFGKSTCSSSFFVNNNCKPTINGNNSYGDISPIYNVKDDKYFKHAPTMRRTYSAALDQSIRMDEKKKYQEMIKKSVFSGYDAFTDYNSTPTGKVFSSSSKGRGQKCVEMAATGAKPKTIAFIDLTSRKPRLSARDTIAKVLNNFESDVVEIKDTDSDIEILSTPPSPEPDFKVERVNSLKTYIDLSEHAHDDWIKNLMKTHTATISKQKQKIEEHEKIKKQLCEINAEIRIKKLEDDVKKVLQIKEILLPIEKTTEKLPILTPEQERKVNLCFDRRGSENEILISKFNLNISRHDIVTLQGLNWLNDEVINFYMNLIIERAKENSKWPKTHAMNTFFYHKISKDGYNSVRRWTKKVDIFSYDILVVPVHLSMHWCLAIVDFRTKSIEYYDSMGSNNDKCLKILHNYLQQEHLDKKRTDYDMSGWEIRNVKKIPQQMNGSDCGMFACTFAEFLTRNAKITFTQEDMPYLRRKMVVEIIEGRLLIS